MGWEIVGWRNLRQPLHDKLHVHGPACEDFIEAHEEEKRKVTVSPELTDQLE